MLKNKSILWVILSFLTPISGFSGTLQQLAVKFGEDIKNTDVKLAVMDFSTGETGKNQDSSVVRERITTFLAQNKNITLIERSLLEKVFQEQKIQISGAVGADTAKQIGELTGASAIVSGTLSELANDEIELNARIIEVGTGRVVSAGQAVFKKDWKFFAPPAIIKDEKVVADSAQDYYRRGVQYHNDGKYNMALEFYTKAIALKPDYLEAYYGRGSVFARMSSPFDEFLGTKSKYDEAIADFNRVIDLKIDYIDGYFNRAMAFSGKGDYEKALLDLTKTIELTASTVTAVDCSRNFIAYPNSPDYIGNYLYRAGVYRNKGALPEAVADYDKVLGYFPNCAYLYTLRGDAYSGKDYPKAISNYSKAIVLSSDTAPNSYSNRGSAYYANGDYDKSIADYSMAIELNARKSAAAKNSVCDSANSKKGDIVPDACLPTQLFDADSSNYYLNRGNAYYMKAEYYKAIADYSKALDLNTAAADDLGPGPSAYIYVNRGNAYLANGEKDKALSDYNKAIELDPKNANVYLNRGNIYLGRYEFEKAFADFNRTIELNPNDAIAYLNRAIIYYTRFEYDKGIEDDTKAIELNPANDDAYFRRGEGYQFKGAYDKAIEDYTKAIEINPVNIEAYIQRGYIYLRNSTSINAIDDFNRAIKLDPKRSAAYSGRGSAYRNLHEYTKALEDFDKALEIDPKDIAGTNRTELYIDTGKYDKAINDCTEEIKRNSSSDIVYEQRGRAYLRKGVLDKAIADFNVLIKRHQDFEQYYISRGEAYARKKDYAKAIWDYTKVIEIDPNSQFAPTAYSQRAAAYYATKDYAQAIRDCTKAIELDSESGPAYRWRAESYYALGEYKKSAYDVSRALELFPGLQGKMQTLIDSLRTSGY